MDALLERDDALKALQAVVERVRATDVGEVVIVSGEAGVGKTSLVRSLADGVEAVEVLWGACDGLRTPRALGPLLDIAAAARLEAAPRDELLAAVLRRFATASQTIVAVIEDAHWADDGTLDALTLLGRRIAGTRAVLVVTYRDDEVGGRHPLRVVLGDIAAAISERIHLVPLSADAVRVLAAGHDVDPDALHAVTGGNPFFVTESLAAGMDAVPDSVRDAVLARAARLSPAARRALEAVAVVPGHAELWLVDGIAGPDAPAVDECVEGGMVEVAGGVARLRHELARLAIVDAVAPARRRGLHRQVLAVLGDTADPARLVHHAVEAGDVDAVVAHAPLAADGAAAAGAHRAAAQHLDDALRHADRYSVDERAGLYTRLGQERHVLSDFDASIDAFEAARACWRELGDAGGEAAVLALQGGPLVGSGRTAEAEASTARAVALLEPLGPSRELAEAYGFLASTHMLARELAEAVEQSFAAEQMAEELGGRDVVSYARIQGGVAQFMAGDEAGLARIHSGIDIASELGLDNRVALGWLQIGSGGGEVRRYDVAVPALLEGRRLCRERELLANELYITAWLARCHLEQGRWDDAGELASEVLGTLRAVGISRFVALLVVGRLRARRGDPDVWPPLDEALDLARQTGHLQRLWPVAVARAEAAWLEGRIADEAALLVEVDTMASGLAYPWAVGEVRFWRWRAGEVDELTAEAPDVYRLHAEGRIHEAAAGWRALGCPYEEADALVDAPDAASVRSALSAFESLGARPAMARASRRLRAMGERVPRGPNRTARGNPGGLTDREVDVLVLVAAGSSNREVAVRLGISEKTAGHHVSHILAKLGAANRAEAAVAASRMGIVSAEM